MYRLVEGRELIFGGVTVPYEKGFLGRFDADMLIYAVMGALLGTVALGDIGQHSPDTDLIYKGVSSIELLEHVGKLLEEKDCMTENINATVIAQRPKLAPYHSQMTENTVAALNLSVGRMSVKAATEERPGFTGSREGVSSQAIILSTTVGNHCYNKKTVKSDYESCRECC